MRTTISNLIRGVTLTVVIVIAGVAAGQGFAAVAQRSNETSLTPADDFGTRHADAAAAEPVKAGGLTPMDDYGVRALSQQRTAVSPLDDYGIRHLGTSAQLTPQDDYGVRHLNDDR